MSAQQNVEDPHRGGDTPADEEHHAPGGNGKYIAVFLALCGLTMMSFLTYFEWWDEAIPASVSMTFMMAVSCTKALLVMGFFMHLIWEANWKYVLTIPAGMMSIFLILMLVPDIGCRYGKYTEERLLHAADPGTASYAGHHDAEHEGEGHPPAEGGGSHDHDEHGH